jgi:hypothetical protein
MLDYMVMQVIIILIIVIIFLALWAFVVTRNYSILKRVKSYAAQFLCSNDVLKNYVLPYASMI